MRKINIALLILATIVGFNKTIAQDSGVSKSLGLYVFPSNNQDKATQEADEFTCFKWAKEQTGYDPMNPPKYVPNQVDQSPDGSTARGAARGAAGGAAIGAIAGDAGEGAAIGAIVGGVRGRRSSRANQQQQQQANNNAAAAASTDAKNDYNKAFSACMKGKGYTVE